jgi:small-conductance mechanosensitive channel
MMGGGRRGAWVSTRRLLVWLVLFLSVGAARRASAQEASVGQADAEAATAPVEIDGVTLFRVRGVSSLPAEQRARAIEERLTAVAADPSTAPESLRTVEVEGTTRLMAGDRPLMTVVDADAALEQLRRSELAVAHLGRLRQALVDYRVARSPGTLKRAFLTLLVATLLLVVVVAALLRFWRALDRFVMRRLEARIRSVEIQSFEIMRAEQIWSALRSGLLAIRMIVLLGLGLVYLNVVLAQFPWTRGLSRDMASFVLGPLQVMAQGIVASIPSLVFLVVLFLVIRLLLRLLRLFFQAVQRGTVTLAGFEPEWAEPTYKIVRLAVVGFALVVAYPYIPGSRSAAFQGVSLFIGIIFSLGSSSAISNIIAGYMMTYRRALRVGDRVKIGEAFGDVVEMRLQVTHLRSFKNEEIIIPNSQILAGEVINYSSLSREHGLILHTDVGIRYEIPWRQVEAMLLMAADRTEGLSREPRPFVFQKALGEFAVTYELNAYCKDARLMMKLYTALHRNILDVFNEYGVQIMTPAYEGDPEQPKVVPRTDWYAAPAPQSSATKAEAGS